MLLFKAIPLFLSVTCLLNSTVPANEDDEVATGVVFVDTNGNRTRETDKTGLAGVGVSNGREVVQTDADGRYSLAVDSDSIVFVIKLGGYQTRTDKDHLARFYYIHKPAGSPKNLGFPGVEPTGPLPAAIDFPLYPAEEPASFDVIFFGDPPNSSGRTHLDSSGDTGLF